MGTTTDQAVPVVDFDPFSVEFLSDPYPYHTAIREVGPVLRLGQYQIWATGRYEEVRAALNDWESYCSSAGVGLADFRKEEPFRPPSIILEADPPLHTRTRGVLTRILSPGAVRKMQETFQAEAERLIDELIERGSFDVMKDLAEVYPVKVFPDAVGLSDEGRENLLPYGSMVFNAFGPRNELFRQSVADREKVQGWIMSQCSRRALAPGGFGTQIYEAADAGELTETEAGLLVRSFLSAGVDTTVNGLGNALYCFVQYPKQWERLRASPSLARQAFEEVLRFESPVQTFFRTTTRETRLAGVRIGEGEKILLFLASANRDPIRWEEPDRFDINRRASGHMAFGTGIHGCVGQAVARAEAECVLTALARRVARIEPAGEPQRRLNNTLRGLARLPVTVHPA